MTTAQWDFLKESDTSLGLFYPLHYIVAGYADLAAAKDAEDALIRAGVTADNVRAVSGEFVARYLEARNDESWLEHAEASLVKIVGTEMTYLHQDQRLARSGGAFLFMYAPDDAMVATAKRVLNWHMPEYARRYLHIAIQVIAARQQLV